MGTSTLPASAEHESADIVNGKVKDLGQTAAIDRGMKKRLHSVKDYEQSVGPETVDRISRKAAALQGFRVINFNSTGYGGGVAEVLTGMTLLNEQHRDQSRVAGHAGPA
jgi:hypothetical protein